MSSEGGLEEVVGGWRENEGVHISCCWVMMMCLAKAEEVLSVGIGVVGEAGDV